MFITLGSSEINLQESPRVFACYSCKGYVEDFHSRNISLLTELNATAHASRS